MKKYLAGAALGAIIASTSTASAQSQEPLPLNRYNPSWTGDHFFGVQSPFAAGHLDFHGGVILDYAHNPLVLRRELPDGDEDIGSIVEHQLFLHVNATFALWERLAINVNLPIALFQEGESPSADGVSFSSPEGADIGDLRIGLRGRLFGEYEDPFQIGIGAELWAPTGNSDSGSYVGNGSVRGMPSALIGGMIGRFIYSANLGVEFAKAQAILDAQQGHMFRWGLAGGVLLGDKRNIQLGAELYGGLVFEDVKSRTTNAELLFGGKYRFLEDFVVGAAVGPGLAPGIGSPDVRALFTFAYSPNQLKEKDGDRDNDGIKDNLDACPDQAGVANPDPTKHGCPPPADRDRDGILDINDACPDQAGPANADPAKNGCPLPGDRDGDGITDDLDACPDVKGVANADPKLNGCPPDSDGDGIIDAEDACPNEAGVPNADKSKHGCPPPTDKDGDGIFDKDDACPDVAGTPSKDPKKHGCPKVVVTEKEIKILERVEFDTDKATIRPVSNDILDQVAKVMKDNPDITKIEVQGHTDNKGPAWHNKALSGRRAKAVVDALVKRGVERSRLTSIGHGEEKPIASNDTEEGRQTNRRVQFKILERKKK